MQRDGQVQPATAQARETAQRVRRSPDPGEPCSPRSCTQQPLTIHTSAAPIQKLDRIVALSGGVACRAVCPERLSSAPELVGDLQTVCVCGSWDRRSKCMQAMEPLLQRNCSSSSCCGEAVCHVPLPIWNATFQGVWGMRDSRGMRMCATGCSQGVAARGQLVR